MKKITVKRKFLFKSELCERAEHVQLFLGNMLTWGEFLDHFLYSEKDKLTVKNLGDKIKFSPQLIQKLLTISGVKTLSWDWVKGTMVLIEKTPEVKWEALLKKIEEVCTPFFNKYNSYKI